MRFNKRVCIIKYALLILTCFYQKLIQLKDFIWNMKSFIIIGYLNVDD